MSGFRKLDGITALERLGQRWGICGLWSLSDLLPVSAYNVLLAQSGGHLFTSCLWLLSGCQAARAEWRSCDAHRVACKALMFTVWPSVPALDC